MVQHYYSICLPELARRRVYICICAHTNTHRKGFSRYKINIYLSHASLVRKGMWSNSVQSVFFLFVSFSLAPFFFSLKETERVQKRKAKKNLHQIAIRRVLWRVTFRNRHIRYIHTRIVESYQILSHSFELSYDVNVRLFRFIRTNFKKGKLLLYCFFYVSTPITFFYFKYSLLRHVLKRNDAIVLIKVLMN